jgi:hypothetical protein
LGLLKFADLHRAKALLDEPAGNGFLVRTLQDSVDDGVVPVQGGIFK